MELELQNMFAPMCVVILKSFCNLVLECMFCLVLEMLSFYFNEKVNGETCFFGILLVYFSCLAYCFVAIM